MATHPEFFFELEFLFFTLSGEFAVEVVLFLAVLHLQSNLGVFVLLEEWGNQTSLTVLFFSSYTYNKNSAQQYSLSLFSTETKPSRESGSFKNGSSVWRPIGRPATKKKDKVTRTV